MLKYLRIENIAVIEETEIDFTKGFNVLTGETGAGKSIIIDSINAVLGERTSKDLIRKDCEKATVSAIFGDFQSEIKDLLESSGNPVDDDGNILISRTLTQTGGTVKINGKTATVGVLKEIGKYLIDIHGQHDSGLLLNPDNHCLYIDRMSDIKDLISDYYAEFKHLNAVRRELNALETDEDEKIRRKEYLEFCIKELDDAKIEVGERDSLKEKLKIAENYEKTAKALQNTVSCLSGGEELDGAVLLTENALKYLSAVKMSDVNEPLETLSRISAELDTVCENIKDILKSSGDFNSSKENIAERLDTVNKLIHKYGGSEAEMFAFYERAKNELENILTSGEKEKELSDELDNSTKRLIELAQKITDKRIITANKFSKEVTDVLKYLDMKNVEFTVSINKGRYTKNGCDQIEFTVKTNVGEDFKPLHKIASGGELSRIMLAIKSVLADNDDTETMIFDEIDTGISGFAADKVGNQIKKLSKISQVICVTHLAQIAAYADNHLKIEKTVNDSRTFTNVYTLAFEDRITEIARIMSGTAMTDNLYNSAKELLDRSK